MAARGPVPKRSEERRRRNKQHEPERIPAIVENVEIPPARDDWHELAREWYESLARSGQARYFEPSDWAAARVLATVLTKNLNQRKFSAVLFASVWSGMSDLLTTEASRRRVRMEIEREPAAPLENVISIADRRKAMGG